MIVLLDPMSDRSSCFWQIAILRHPDFLFLQAAMEPLDIAVAFRVMIRRTPMSDAQPPKCFQEPRRSELRAIVSGQRHASFTAALGQPCQHGLLHGYQRVFGPAATRKIPSHDFPRAAVDHTHQVRPAHRRARPPDFRHVRLPDLIRFTGFHSAPFFFPPRPSRRLERTSKPRSRITRSTRLRFTRRPSFLPSHHATRR